MADEKTGNGIYRMVAVALIAGFASFWVGWGLRATQAPEVISKAEYDLSHKALQAIVDVQGTTIISQQAALKLNSDRLVYLEARWEDLTSKVDRLIVLAESKR